MDNTELLDDKNDPVVQEIPVFLSKKFADKLYIFQYPLKTAEDGYDNSTIIKTQFRPENEVLQMEVAINTQDAHYDLSKGEAIARNAENTSKRNQEEEERMFDSNLMDKIVLQSTRALPNCDNYAIGFFQDNGFHLTPIKGILQMRPEFNYHDRADKKGKEDGKNAEDFEEEDEPAKQVNVTFARHVPDFIQKMREQSFQTHTKKILEEAAIPCEYKPVRSQEAEITRMDLFDSVNEESMNNLNLKTKEYLSLLAPPQKEEQFSKANIPSHTTFLAYIRTLPLVDQVKILMKGSKVMAFEQLRCLLSSEHETSLIIKYLQQVAVLVRGNWVVSSEIIYPKDSASAHSGIPAELMCRARDYVLLSFTEHEYVDRRAISSVVKLPAEEITEIFTNIAKHQPKKGWRLIVSDSKDFIQRYQDVAQRQELLWEAKRKHLREVMESSNQQPQRQRRKSNREFSGSESEEKSTGRSRKSLRDSSVSDN